MMNLMPLPSVPHTPAPRPPARRPLQRLAASATAAVAAAVAAAALGGCSPQGEPPVVLQIAIGTSQDQVINGQLHREFREQQQRLEQSFRQLHPSIRFRFSLYPEERLVEAMRRRQWSGLEPDLLYVTNRAAHLLLQAGITTPYPTSAEIRSRLEPTLLRLVSSEDGTLTGLPVLQQLQIGCYDNRRLPQPPASLEALVAASAGGAPIGLSVNPENLFWTVGSTGALPAVVHVLSGKPPTEADRQALGRWLAWLTKASSQQRVVFYGNQEMAEEELAEGRLAWIPCRSTTLPRLRQRLGTHLGVAPLPDGANSMASPVNHIRVMALGRNSTPRARQAAMAFSAFTNKPLVQRTVTLGSYTVLPVDRQISMPVSSSQTLTALVRARDQGLQTDQLMRLLRSADQQRPAKVQALISEVVFGELSPEQATPRLINLLREKP
jgi:hypothetical protein